MTREEIHRQFVAQFADGKANPASFESITEAEKVLGCVFPRSFVSFATLYGAIYTPSILDLVTGGESEVAPEGASFDVQNLLSPEEIVRTTHAYRKAGMETSLVAIASDCMGNAFAFRTNTGDRTDDTTVYIFDHDFATVKEEAKGFDVWLKSFLDMKQ